MDKQEAVRYAAREHAQVMMLSGEMELPPDYTQQAQEEVARFRAGKPVKTLKQWKSSLNVVYKDVLVFGALVLAHEEDWWMLFDHSGKRIWNKHKHQDLYALYEVVTSISLLCDWTQLEDLPLPERFGVEWRLTELTWSTGQSMYWELFAMMTSDLARAAEAANALSRSPL